MSTHTHQCPQCHERVPCNDACDTEPDLGTASGCHVVCERCATRNDPAAHLASELADAARCRVADSAHWATCQEAAALLLEQARALATHARDLGALREGNAKLRDQLKTAHLGACATVEVWINATHDRDAWRRRARDMGKVAKRLRDLSALHVERADNWRERSWVLYEGRAEAERERDDARAKAEQHERDWYAAKAEFGAAMGRAREQIRALNREAEAWMQLAERRGDERDTARRHRDRAEAHAVRWMSHVEAVRDNAAALNRIIDHVAWERDKCAAERDAARSELGSVDLALCGAGIVNTDADGTLVGRIIMLEAQRDAARADLATARTLAAQALAGRDAELEQAKLRVAALEGERDEAARNAAQLRSTLDSGRALPCCRARGTEAYAALDAFCLVCCLADEADEARAERDAAKTEAAQLRARVAELEAFAKMVRDDWACDWDDAHDGRCRRCEAAKVLRGGAA